MKNVEKIENYIEELFPDPKCELNYKKDYELLISVMLSAQTTDKRVNIVTKELFSKYNTLKKLKDANIDEIKNIIRSLGSYNKKALYIKEISTILVDKYNSIMPRERKELESLPGVGRKTVNVVFGELNVERVSKRLYLAALNDSVLDVEMKLRKKFKKETWSKRHKQLVLFGRYYCKAIKPECESCKLKSICRYYKKEVIK